MAQDPPPYDPHFRLTLSEPISKKLVSVQDLQLPSEFIYNAVIVSDEGKPVEKVRLQELPGFVISLRLQLSAWGSPAIMESRTWGDTSQREFELLGLAQWQLETRPLTPWQLNFVPKYRSRLVTRAVATVARDWKPKMDGDKVSWSIPFGSARTVQAEQLLTLEKDIAKKFRQKFTDFQALEFAQRYLKYQEQGMKPIQELQDDYFGVPIRTIQRWATMCRRKGLLPSTTQGKASSVTKKRREKNARTTKAKKR